LNGQGKNILYWQKNWLKIFTKKFQEKNFNIYIWQNKVRKKLAKNGKK